MSHRRSAPAACAIAIAAGLLALFSLSGANSTPDATANTAATPTNQAVPGDLVVRTRRAADLDRASAFLATHGYQVRTRVEDLAALSVVAPDGITVGAAARDLIGHAGILYVEPLFRLQTTDAPSDPLYAKEQPYLAAVNAPEAWDIETGRPGVLVAVLDTGIDLAHPDLAGRIYRNPAEIPDNGVDDDGNVCVDDVNGCALVEDPLAGCDRAVGGDVFDDDGHGTFISGIIAARGDGKGMVGVARGVTILPVKVLDCVGTGDSLTVAAGIIYAARAGAKVVNISAATPSDSEVMHEAIRAARSEFGTLVVAASGNTWGEGVGYPAHYAEVLAVGAASAANPDRRAPFSTSGPEVDVVAVGEDIIGTVPKGRCNALLPCIGDGLYASGDGTSFSAPQVTGLVALMLSRRPGMSPDAIVAIIKQTAHPVPPGDRPNWAGAGRIDMLAALRPQFRLGVPGVSRN